MSREHLPYLESLIGAHLEYASYLMMQERKDAALQGSDAIEEIFDPDKGEKKLASYQDKNYEEKDHEYKLEVKKKLAQDLAAIFFGSMIDPYMLTEKAGTDPATLAGNERFRRVFEMSWLSEEDQAHVRDIAFRAIEVMDGGGIGGTTEDVQGSFCCLDRDMRERLPYAAKKILNMLEHNEWVADKKSLRSFAAQAQETEASSSASAGNAILTIRLPNAAVEQEMGVPAEGDERATTPTP